MTPTPTDPDVKPTLKRAAVAIILAVIGHVAVLGGGFLAARSEGLRPPTTEVVTVLTGHVAEDGTGDFQAAGFREAKIRK